MVVGGDHEFDVAVIGMNCRFPGAGNLDEFWEILRDGRETISHFTEQELLDVGVEESRLSNPNYVRAKGVLPDVEFFDHDFFGINHSYAEIMDPQHRLFLQFAWQTIEAAGYDLSRFDGRIGLYAGCAFNTYLLNNLRHADRASTSAINPIELLILTDKDFLTAQAAHHLGLRGPAVTVQTACSTSLVAIHMAAQALLDRESDMALAGAVTVYAPQKKGYIYEPGGLVSPDGHVRSFDAKGQGTTYASGMGLVVLKRFFDAIDDGDTIHAVIKGSAVNNDGGRKAAFKAPSLDGITEVAAAALAAANVEPHTIRFVEGNGSGNPIGDAIEVNGLNRAYGPYVQSRHHCAIGSVKSNLGHLNVAAGVAAFIKAALALRHGQIPPTLNFREANPNSNLDDGPFHVVTQLTPWPDARSPRRAAVNSYGVGGTNAHVVLEEAPVVPTAPPRVPAPELVVLSAKTGPALNRATEAFERFLSANPTLDLGDVAYTLQQGRRQFSYRRAVIGSTPDAVVRALTEARARRPRPVPDAAASRVVWVVPELGTAAAGGFSAFVERHARWRSAFDRVLSQIEGEGLDVRGALFDTVPGAADAVVGELAGFVLAAGLAECWLACGFRPAAIVGAGSGELVAATAAGILSVEDALTLLLAAGGVVGAERSEPYRAAVHAVSFKKPGVPFLSASGGLLSEPDAASPEHWLALSPGDPWGIARQYAADQEDDVVMLDILGSVARTAGEADLSAGAGHKERLLDRFLVAIGRLWELGVPVDWTGLHPDQHGRRIALPTYQFEQVRCWVDRPGHAAASNYDAAL